MDDPPNLPRPLRGRPRPRPKGFDDVPVLSDEEVERRVDVRGGGTPRAPIERPARVPRTGRRAEKTTARDLLLLVGLLIVGLVAVRVILPDGPLTASATSSPGATEAAVVTVAPISTSTQGPTPGLQTLTPILTPTAGPATAVPTTVPTTGPTTLAPTPTLKSGQTPKPTVKPSPTPKITTPPPTQGPTAPNRATVIVVMHVINNSGGSAPASAWTMSVTGEAGGAASKNNFAGSEAGTTVTIPAGQGYRVVDDASQAGYAPRAASADCTRATGVGLAAGTTVTCTITRNDRPRVTVFVDVVNDDGGTADANDWAMSVTSANATPSSFAGSASGTVVVMGFDLSFTISASGPSGYDESTDGACSSALGLGIDDPAAVCTFTENDVAPPPAPGSIVPLLLMPLVRPRRWQPTATG